MSSIGYLRMKPVTLAPSGYSLTVAVPQRRSLLSVQGSVSSDQYSLVRVAIFPASEIAGSVWSKDQFQSKGASLQSLLSFAYDLPLPRVLVPSGLEQERYAVQVWVPSDSANALRPIMQTALAAAAAVRVRMEVRDVAAIAIEGLPGKLRPSRGGQPLSQCQEKENTGQLTAENSGLEVLKNCIEQITGTSVLIPEGMTKTYSFEMRWDSSKHGSFEAALRDQLGLQLQPTNASLSVLTVERCRRSA